MDDTRSVIAELLAVTRAMEAQVDPAGDAFAKLLERRGELIGRLCRGDLDLSDAGLAGIVTLGADLLARAHSRRESLRDEAASLERLAILVRGMKSTFSQSEPAGLDVTA